MSQRSQSSALEQHIQRLQELISIASLPNDMVSYIYHSIAVFHESRQEWDTALIARHQSVEPSLFISPHQRVNSLLGLAELLIIRHNYDEARSLVEEIYLEAQRLNYQRIVVAATIDLATIDLAQGDTSAAEHRLIICRQDARLSNDMIALAEIQMRYAQIASQRGDLLAARQTLTEALDIFTRMGVRYALAKARAARAALDASEIAEPAT